MNFVTDRPPQSALRDLRAHLVRPTTLAALAGAVAVLVLAGPFGTLDRLSLGARAGYWGAVVFSTYAMGAAIDIMFRPRLAGRGRALRVAAVTLATAVAVTGVVAGLNRLLLGAWPDTGGMIWTLAAIFAVAVIATLLLQVQAESGPATQNASDAPPPLLDRVPLDRRGALVALSVEDHYVRIRTTRGETMLLMRLGDAIREAAPTPGLQVHRSHWVALAAVRAVRRDGDRAILEMTVGGDIPASRSHIPALREAGLLPR
ncbi:LytTR family DNA-binding domain-containing protein [Roseicyclus mahoneyensis]|uniref:LytTR family transcriptional regulator n=1 Tax=Roseicyclus mahoneyensis TaxID=164332 RepID=A0A316GKL6_9RHOB|nr:LytTR family DNA-binding domain-containing protein [Roseicyclus mahoneyensis]PWK61186.1 LytTR family transcriptional regulator [Roseicyclus mahoneyensis]